MTKKFAHCTYPAVDVPYSLSSGRIDVPVVEYEVGVRPAPHITHVLACHVRVRFIPPVGAHRKQLSCLHQIYVAEVLSRGSVSEGGCGKIN